MTSDTGKDGIRPVPWCQYRIRSHRQFAEVVRLGRKKSIGTLRFWVLYQEGSTGGLGLIVGKKSGNAPTRNLLKRRVREVYRAAFAEIPSGLFVVVQVLPTAEPLSYGEIDGAFRELLQWICRIGVEKTKPLKR